MRSFIKLINFFENASNEVKYESDNDKENDH